MKVGDAWDEREKIFRNTFGAFTITSKIFILMTFTPPKTGRRMVANLQYTLVGPGNYTKSSIRVSTAWTQLHELIELSRFKVKLVPGLWTLQASSSQQIVATSKFMILPKEKEKLK